MDDRALSTPRLYTAKQTAEITKMSIRKIRELIATGELPCIRIDRSVRVAEEDLLEYLAKRRSGPK